jgi:anti-sigma28 factor (negative regulator of flagellin synthesis)
MEIQPDKRQTDPVLRKRQADAAASRGAKASESSEESSSNDRRDAVELGTTSPQAIARYVDILKAMNPADLHRVEDLRARIKDGSFTATPDELAGPLSDLLDNER